MLHSADLTVDLDRGSIEYHATNHEPWRVTLVETGAETMTGGRLKRVAKYLDPGEPFFFTYGDGVSDVDPRALADFHRSHGKAATITAVAPPGRYGALELSEGRVQRFTEKPPGDNGLINGGFFVLQPEVIDRIDGDATSWEAAPLEGLARDGELMAYRHDGFWAAMDTLRDKNHLEALWASGEAPWRR
ncbi:glucose-1-phosphate cytidylyltransferase [Phenylobacterium sp. J426]|uniref:sugar phosphate nucleotidyltransferase n=1 Tax=Phenylobacterium sp. J426 TaxID=2898439 RepID=UPI002150FB20|nr:sugar phosphate nucleotidyltransferase [Phenylobacterium sp. J426]MCR5873384.1 glucose-1-phosphate cytidylyltransferase [Phenylobacterium sp. J426]